MKFEPIKAPTATDLFVKQIQDKIISGELPAGTRLPSEREMAQQFMVSRAVINNGLRRLVKLHFIRTQPRGGSYVDDFRRTGTLETLNEILNYSGGHFKIKILKSLYQLREQIEENTVKLAAKNRQPAQLRSASGKLMACRNATTSLERAQALFDLTQTITLMSANDVYPLLNNNFRPLYLTLGNWVYTDRMAGEFINAYQELLTAIADGDAELAQKIDHQIIVKSYQGLTKES
jgi:DNA-binding FadR family transcriptional regulator